MSCPVVTPAQTGKNVASKVSLFVRYINGCFTFENLSGFRQLNCEAPDELSFVAPVGEDPLYPDVFSRPITEDDLDIKLVNSTIKHFNVVISRNFLPQRASAKLLLPLMLKEKFHQTRLKLISRRRELSERVSCGE